MKYFLLKLLERLYKDAIDELKLFCIWALHDFILLLICGSIVHVEAETVSEKNMLKRLRRVLAPRVDGSSLVAQQILDAWKDTQTGGREAVINMWNQASGDKETLGLDFFGCRLKFNSDFIFRIYSTTQCNIGYHIECSDRGMWIVFFDICRSSS